MGDVARAKEALLGGDNLPLVVRHYRALFVGEALRLPSGPILYLHGAQDGCIGVELVAGLEGRLSPGSRVAVLPKAEQFPQLEAPGAVVAAVTARIA